MNACCLLGIIMGTGGNNKNRRITVTYNLLFNFKYFSVCKSEQINYKGQSKSLTKENRNGYQKFFFIGIVVRHTFLKQSQSIPNNHILGSFFSPLILFGEALNIKMKRLYRMTVMLSPIPCLTHIIYMACNSQSGLHGLQFQSVHSKDAWLDRQFMEALKVKSNSL